jgi:glycosyltransferase involved in cell wall biosynthesis
VLCDLDPRTPASGSSDLSESIIEYLKKKRFDVHALYFRRRTREKHADPSYHYFKPHVLGNVVPGLFGHVLRSKYDFLVIIGFGALTVSILSLWVRLSSRNGLLLPLWHHDFLFHSYAGRWLFHLRRNLIDYPIIRFTAFPIVCQSDYERRGLSRFSKRIELIRYGIDVHWSQWTRCWNTSARKRDVASGLEIVTSGRLNAGKVPLYFLRVVHRLSLLRRVKFRILAARVDERYLTEFVLEMRRLSLNEVVKIVDVSKWDKVRVLEHIAQADVAVCPSYSESFGVSVVEYLYTGVPVVATRTGVVDYLEARNCLVAVNWGDIEGMVAAILKVSEMSQQDRDRLLYNARNVVETELTKDRFLHTLWVTLENQSKVGSE